MTYDEKVKLYEEHLKGEDERGHHPDGCYYCGQDHPSDCCRSDERDEWWRDEKEAIR